MNLRPAALTLALAASSTALGNAVEPPARLAQLGYVEGQVWFDGAQAPATSTLPDRPLRAGDRLVTEPGGRAEFAFGNATIRLDEQSELAVVDLDETTVRIELAAGSASVYLRDLLEDETFEIVTPNAAVALHEPGEYRVDVDADDYSVINVRAGAAKVVTAGGTVRVAAGQRVRLDGRDAYARLEPARPTDAFDDWVLERELRLAEAERPRYTPYEGESYEELDRHGEWYDEPRYGRVWMPAYGYSSWSPYHSGYWQRVGFGWSWYDPSPWGFFTFHSGRWAYLNHLNRWCWVPGPRFHRRHFDHDDIRPYGQPRRRTRDREEREDAPRTANRRLRAVDELPRVATPSAAPRRAALRRIDVERPPTPRREPASRERRQGGTFIPSGRREQSQPSQAPAAAPRGGNTNTRPARPTEARSQRSSESAQPSTRPFGRPSTRRP